MTQPPARPRDVGRWNRRKIAPGEKVDLLLSVSESYSGATVKIPVYVWRGPAEGPTVFITAAVHGDELNGTGAIRQLLLDPPFDLASGSLILVPVVNLLGFERHSRYLPDRRDLNRSFPGTAGGSLASRFAQVVFHEIVGRAHYGIDLHTAAVRRTNFPNVRADMSNDGTARLAEMFGAELIVAGKGPKGCLRRSAVKSGCPTVILEAGEVWKVEPAVVEYALRGIGNVLKRLGMIEGDPVRPPFRAIVDRTRWVRAQAGGFLQFHVGPGEIVEKGTPIATNTSLVGRAKSVVHAPRDGIILGMTTLPAVAPGDAIVHLAFPGRGEIRRIEEAVQQLPDASLHQRLREDLASNVMVTDRDDENLSPDA